MNEQAPCQCKGPDVPGDPNWQLWCPRYQIMQGEYHWKMCAGLNCAESKSQSYRQKWARRLAELSAGGPGILQKAVNASKAVARVIARGLQLVPDDVRLERERICDACDMQDKTKAICTHPQCGCPLKRQLKNNGMLPGKLELATEACPMGLWKDYRSPGSLPSTYPGAGAVNSNDTRS